MRIKEVIPKSGYQLQIVADDGRIGIFDVNPYFEYEVFDELKDPGLFAQVSSGGYFIEWTCGADLSADTIEAHWELQSDKGQIPRKKRLDVNRKRRESLTLTSR